MYIIVSNSEDKSVRVWDMSKRSGTQTFPASTIVLILAAHPEVNLLAAAARQRHDHLQARARAPAYAHHQGTLYYVKDRYLRAYDYQSQRDAPLISIRRAAAPSGSALARAAVLQPGGERGVDQLRHRRRLA